MKYTLLSAQESCQKVSHLAHRDASITHDGSQQQTIYVSTQNPSENLLTLIHFVMKVYTPMWFAIICSPNIENGSCHLFKTETSDEVQKIVLPVVQRNSYFAHSEAILLAMITDERPHIRELGWRRIKSCRSLSGRDNMTVFKLPNLNSKCTDYTNMIDWKNDVSEPPLTRQFTDEEIDNFIRSRHLFFCPKFPNHTQRVERTIKMVSEASSSVCSHEAREGFILNRLASRNRVPTMDSKKDFKF